MPAKPSNTTLIQVGFNYSLNYPFVVSTPGSANQIFDYLPAGIAYGLGVSQSDVVMYGLTPYDTTTDLGYITTLAMAYVPAGSVDQLQLDVHTPVATLYNNPTAPVRVLLSMVNPSIPILPGSTIDGSSSSSSSNPSDATTENAGNGAPLGGDSSASSTVKGSSVGIGVGAVAGAAVYAAAMVYLARRYRAKRQGKRHQRALSVPTAERGPMSQRNSAGMGAYFMSGGRGRYSGSPRGSRNSGGSSNSRSVREAGISAPVMAENSLGWN